jgi:hypothetical protein
MDHIHCPALCALAAVCPVPIFLLIDKSKAPEIDLEDIYDALGGTSTVNLVRDKAIPEIRQFYMSRVKDGIDLTINGGDRLSAIILCNSDISRQDLALRLTGDIILNPYTSVKVDENIVKELKATLFDVSI